MNKLTIPVILVATIMVAGVFVIMPVEQASTVHTTIATGTTTTLVAGPFLTVGLAADIFGANDDGIDVSDADTITLQLTLNSGVTFADDCDLALTVTDATGTVDFTPDVLHADALIYDAGAEVDPVAGDVIVANVDISAGTYNTIDAAVDFENGGAGDCDGDSDWNMSLSIIKKGVNLQ